ncbi:NAD-dependent epimerase/dehydratase family protein [Pseudoalteromonas sp. A757]|uniref:NAD-dependent epimerase/dehydratase family protein n=1 Tax=Pseudoalteromonas sp. A757 TaxID=2250709 RepID=UPI000FFE5E85|nr:NAD-dependent epimerase/dehydratase family protein [Pseudoalteromonas sp. A757]RXE84501.1 hypothetical protein DRB05_21520 [Pseudoalteromonas sp. A757]
MEQVLVTGANGFVGKALARDPRTSGFSFLTQQKIAPGAKNWLKVRDFADSRNRDFSSVLKNISVVVHLASAAHRYNLDENYLYSVNFAATVSLAEQAAKAGVKRFIYLNTINVYGSQTHININTELRPLDYNSKIRLSVESELRRISVETGMEIVIIRSPLIYGKDAPGNFGTLLKVAKNNYPLPLGAINNHRSYAALDNVVDLLIVCVSHPKAKGQCFLISDDEVISTSELLKKLIISSGNKPRLLPIPTFFLNLAAAIVGKKSTVEKLSSSLIVDIEHTKRILGWEPPVTIDEGIRRCF